MTDLNKMTVKKLAIESEDNKLMQDMIWTKAYDLEAENKVLKERLSVLIDSMKAIVDSAENNLKEEK